MGSRMIPSPSSASLMMPPDAEQHAEGEGAQDLVDPIRHDQQQQHEPRRTSAAPPAPCNRRAGSRSTKLTIVMIIETKMVSQKALEVGDVPVRVSSCEPNRK